MRRNLEEIEEIIGYKFKNKELLKTALTHTSYAYEHKKESNEKLEYLGDSILEFISSEWLYNNYYHLKEGEMTKVRATAVCEDSLYKIALKLNFSDFLFLGKSELSSNNKKKAILADSVEAVIAAMYLDSNIDVVRNFIIDNIKEIIEISSHHAGEKDYKTVLQEKLQVNGDVLIKYNLLAEKGPDHDKIFTVEVTCDGKKLASGTGKSKKQAEMEAAKKALDVLK